MHVSVTSPSTSPQSPIIAPLLLIATGSWLSTYMLKCNAADDAVTKLVDFFKSYDVHQSHGRSIDRDRAREQGLNTVENVENIAGLGPLVQSLLNQYEFWFDKTKFYKNFEDARGTNWGPQVQQIAVPFPFQLPTAPQPPQS